MNRLRASFALAVLLSVPVSGCFGKFALTRTVYNFNASVNDKFLRSLLTWVMGPILPVYGLATLADFVVFNTLEFWTGSNPVDTGRINTAEAGDTTLSARRLLADGKPVLVFEAEKAGAPAGRVEVTKLGDDAVEAKTFDAAGNLERTERIPMRDVSAERLAELEIGG